MCDFHEKGGLALELCCQSEGAVVSVGWPTVPRAQFAGFVDTIDVATHLTVLIVRLATITRLCFKCKAPSSTAIAAESPQSLMAAQFGLCHRSSRSRRRCCHCCRRSEISKPVLWRLTRGSSGSNLGQRNHRSRARACEIANSATAGGWRRLSRQEVRCDKTHRHQGGWLVALMGADCCICMVAKALL